MDSNVISFKGGDNTDGEVADFAYTYLFAEELDDLEDMVDDYISDGWRPHQGPIVAAGGVGYCQAMKFKKKKPIEGGDGGN